MLGLMRGSLDSRAWDPVAPAVSHGAVVCSGAMRADNGKESGNSPTVGGNCEFYSTDATPKKRAVSQSVSQGFICEIINITDHRKG